VAVQSSRKEMALGPRPGQKIRSGVVPPQQDIKVSPTEPGPGASHDGLDNSNDIPALPSELNSGDAAMIDLDE
jgi:minichromosome maintenance protein 10